MLASIVLGLLPRPSCRKILLSMLLGILALLAAGTGGLLGGSLNASLPSSVWGTICGIAVGGVVSLVSLVGGRWLWVIGFMAGIVLGAILVDAADLRGHYLGLVLAAVSASLYAWSYSALLEPYVSRVMLCIDSGTDGASSCDATRSNGASRTECSAAEGGD